MGALIFAVKAALAAIPNVQLNALLIILTVIFFGWKALAAVGVYVLLEGLIFGFGVWWVSYVFIWPLLVPAAMLFRRSRSALLWAVVAGFWGLYVLTVDGETADEAQQQWWCLTKDGEMSPTGVDDTVIADGEHYEFELKTGW